MKFYNRTKEIEELKRIRGRAFESRSRMTVITGRRRIGKTSLALRATQGEYPTVYLFVSRKKRGRLVRRVCRTYINCSQLLCAIGDQNFQVAVSDYDGAG